jgi:hypothetical protein
MPFRQLPASDPTRTQALTAALQKSAAVAPADRLISAATAATLTTFAANWQTQVAERADALGLQTASTAVLDGIAARLRMTVSHFIQVYQFGVARGVFSPSGRSSYELSVNEETVPSLATEADLLLWANRIVTGETRRTANFPTEPAMAMPSATDVSDALADYQNELAHQTTVKDAYDEEQADVAALRPAADALIKDIWDEVEFALRRLDPPSLRRRAREWGVFYALRPGEPEETTDTPPPAG